MKIPSITLFKTKSHDAGWFAIGLGLHGIYLAKVRLAGAMPRVERCEYHETGTVTAALLEKLRREADIDDHDVATLLAPGEYQLLLVEAPNVPVDEMKTAVRWKIKDGLNYHIDDATVDMVRIPASKYSSGRPQSLYAIAAANNIIRERIGMFEQAKLALNVIDIPEMAQRNIAALFESDDRALVVMTFDDFGGLLTFTAGGELYLSRRIEINVGQLLDANENLRQQYRDRVETELHRSLDYFDRQYNHLPVDMVLVCVPDNTGLVEFLASAMDTRVQKLDLSQVMDISAVPALADSEFVAHSLPTLGAALRKESRVL
ncbi:MAG: putative mannose-sensitive agglutinin (MSHA) biogenesis protein MshI [Candidatus Gallionella acididurans]|uniref:Putative mannose-sensitive agglutinin (MSHA) biogenesis protein MshI n=1 Tax=Candidatus Gallionella acididurans TaxID=1796491 RepID=A0A139BTL7_9PROT|nr:MAG: putative mannose-sensitive agglutinin (MSHA) biogenesis protein MshI [Candidatus Gallionella acididurans]